MRIFINTSDNAITHALPATNAVGETVTVNGQWFLNAPTGQHQEITASDYILNAGVVDAGSLVTKVFTAQLDAFPMYSFNQASALCSAADVDAIDGTGTVTTLPAPFNGNTYSPRYQSGDATNGTVGGGTALLPVNTVPATDAVGMIQTDTINIAGDVAAGVDTVACYWDIWSCSTSQDIRGTGQGPHAAVNTPALKTWTRLDPDLATFYCFVSVDGGTTYTRASHMVPTIVPALGTDLRLCFVNNSATKVYLNAYSVMY